MGIFNRTDQTESNLITCYKGEDGLHPQFKNAFDWYEETVLTHIVDGWHDEVILAGGALRSYFTSTPVRDFDIYLNEKTLKQFTDNFSSGLKLSHSWAKISDTELSWTYRKMDYDTATQELLNVTFNIMKRPYASREEVINPFDFTVCMCAIQKDALTYHPDYFIDLVTKSLRVNNPEDALSSLWRTQKYGKMGYSISREDLWELTESIHELNALPTIVTITDDKAKHSLKTSVKTLEEIFRSS